MAEDDDKDNKTEEPSSKRLTEAREKGQIPTSREVNHFFMIGAMTLIIVGLMPSLSKRLMTEITPFISRSESFPVDDMGPLKNLFIKVAGDVAMLLAVPMGVLLIAAVAAGGLQTRFNVSSESINPKLEKISPLKGIKRLFSLNSLVEFGKSLTKICVVGAVAAMAIWPQINPTRNLPDKDLSEILLFLFALSKHLMGGVLIALAVIAMADYLYQRHRFLQNLRMTKQEVKDEYKQMEGDPIIKNRIRQLRFDRSRKRMMANVPKADVIITNPTHYAVAIKYDAKTMSAPVVVAKGEDRVALKIREIAEENKILVMRNPPLARALYASAKVDEEIPLEYYHAVAQIIGYIYKLRTRRAPQRRNTLTMPPRAGGNPKKPRR